MFRFNPGKEQRIFPKKHLYVPKGCGDCGLNQYAVGKGKPQCAVCNAFKDINESFDEFRKLAKEYNLTRFDFYSSGYIATHPSHNFVTKVQSIKNDKKEVVYKPIFSSGGVELIVAGKLCDQGGKVICQKEKGNKGKIGNIKYKGDLDCRKNETIQLVFVKKQERGVDFWRLNFVRSWKNNKAYKQWIRNKKRQRK